MRESSEKDRSAERELALAQACFSSDAQGARAALAAGADPNSAVAWSLAGGWPIVGERPRPLHMAFRHGDAEMARVLIEAGADVDLPSLDGVSAARWLSMGMRGCAALWIEAGGDPWGRDAGLADPDEGCLAMMATRGGGEVLWSLIAQRSARGWVALGPSSKESGSLASLGANAIRYENEAALRVLASLGWAPTGVDVVDCFEHWGSGAHWESRAFKQALVLRALGAPMPEQKDTSRLVRFHGRPSINRLMSQLEERFAKLDARQIAKSARRSKPSANAARSRPRI